MSAKELTNKIESLRDLESLIEEAKAEAETLRDEIKSEMMLRDVEEMSIGQYIVRFTSVLSNRFDTTGFKKAYAELYKQYTKQTASRRFTISA
jgi:predicted phage-related endonuclease